MRSIFVVLLLAAVVQTQFNFHGMSRSFFSTDEEFPTQLQNFEGRTQTEIRTLKEKVEKLEKLIEGLQSILMKEWNQTESGSKYRLFEERKNWDNAEKHCQGFGAHLAIIDNEAKNTFVTNLINSSETSDFAWIGMKTKTTTQTSTPFTNFDSESPIDGCAVMDSKGVWAIRSCIQLRPFVCQIIRNDVNI
ncbi:CRE-CLEC-146 protein [Caenorhabditis remanei]|uniref:CRE-CLEC-146 protein n=1 Tax=Caenorhabditis remanei TaxID=31234 RepID=E3MMV8_CAERE|nr:CRE-CLEC-146 protein [Caenorhabditis remanei]